MLSQEKYKQHPHGIALRLRRICDSDEKFKHSSQECKVKFITTFNPAIPSIEGLIKKHIHYLHSDWVLQKVISNKKFSVIYKRNKNLKEMVAPSLYPKPSIKSNRTIVSCNKCDICRNFLIVE